MPSLTEALYTLPTARLRTIIRNRGIDLHRLASVSDKRTLVQRIATELSRQGAVAEALLSCDTRGIRLLQLASTQDAHRGIRWDHLVEMAGGPEVEAAVSDVMQNLEDSGLAFRVGPVVFIPESVQHQVPASLSDLYPLARLLSVYDAPAIRRLMSGLGLSESAGTKAHNITLISDYLLQATHKLRFNPPLDSDELAVLDYLVQAGGSATPIEVATSVLNGKTDDFFRYEWQNRWKLGNPRNAVDTLLGRGLVYVVTAGYGYNFFLVIPCDLMRAITGDQNTGFWTDPVPGTQFLPDAAVPTKHHNALTRDVIGLLSFFSVQDAFRTNTGYVHKGSLKAIARTLTISDEQYAAFVYCLCRQAGLAAPEGERSRYRITNKGADWLQQTSYRQVHALYSAWLQGVIWNEMYAEPLARHNEYRSLDIALNLRVSAFKIIINAAKSQPDSFISIDSVVSTLAFQRPLLMSGSNNYTAGFTSSMSIFVQRLVTECMYWCGMVELCLPGGSANAMKRERTPNRSAESSEDVTTSDATGFRLTPLGRLILAPLSGEHVEIPDQPREDSFVLQANLEVFVPPYLHPYILYRLLMITEPPAKGGASTTLSLTRDSIRRAFDLGETPEEMIAFLREHSRTGVAQNVEYLINEVGGKHGHIHVGKAEMYVRVNSPLLLKELQARRELKGMFVRAITDTVAILRGTDVEKALKELRKAGYLPVSDDDAAATARVEERLTARSSNNEKTIEKALTPSLPEPIRIVRESIDTVLDWNVIATEDGQAWHTRQIVSEAQLAKPSGAHDNAALIRLMVNNAAVTHNVVDLVYRNDQGEVGRYLFEPSAVSGDTAYGYFQVSEDAVVLEIRQIRWARLTSEKF